MVVITDKKQGFHTNLYRKAITMDKKKTVYVVFDEKITSTIKAVFSTEEEVYEHLDMVRQLLMMREYPHSPVELIESSDNAVRHRYFHIEADFLSCGFHVEKREIYGSEDFGIHDIDSVWAVTSFAEPWVSYLFMNKQDAKPCAKDINSMTGGDNACIQKVFLKEYQFDECYLY